MVAGEALAFRRDAVEDGRRIVQDRIVRETEEDVTLFGQDEYPSRVIFRLTVVDGTVEFHPEPGGAAEVKDVRADRVLATKLQPT